MKIYYAAPLFNDMELKKKCRDEKMVRSKRA